MDAPKVTPSQREATAKFHERMAQAFAAKGRTADAEAAKKAATLVRQP
jgi:hypothetical protein